MNKHPIIANGEMYVESIDKKKGGGSKKLPRNYAEAKQRVITDLEQLTSQIRTDSEWFLDEKVICIRLEPKFEAKSYVPCGIVSAMNDGESKIIGGRKYICIEDEKEEYAKLYFVKTTGNGIRKLQNTLIEGLRDNVASWKEQIQSINSISLLTPEEKIMGFDDDWTIGTVEFVLHPLCDSTNEEIERFFSQSEINRDNARIKTYDDGITFISAKCSESDIERIKKYNPLRAAHPIGQISIENIRNYAENQCPSVLPAGNTPTVRIGVFDGGVDKTHPLLNGYVSVIDKTIEREEPILVQHGQGVCSAILYGNIAGKKGTDYLEPPCVTVDCYRVLPLHDKNDIDLYEIIDEIEETVSNSKEIKLYNLSLGPRGAILDDSINRFTYALDKLSYDVEQDETNPLFIVAVGNDGGLVSPMNRIQSPSDIVNGIGVGAYSYDVNNCKEPTQYSCIGPGREGAKIKPDLLEFGGSIDRPFVFPALDKNGVSASCGTSFATPIITGKIGKLMAMSENVSPQIGRTLLVHNSERNEHFPIERQGFGFCPEKVEDVLECTDNHVTIMYAGSIRPTNYIKLPIFAPEINEMRGMVTIQWTVATVVAPYSNDPDAYTNNCLEDVFIPHSMIYNFTKQGMPSKKINFLDPSQIQIARELLNNGYQQSSVPVSHPAKKTKEEKELRNDDYKWDTIIRKSIKMRSSSLFNPALTLHALGRNGYENEEMRYYVVVTIDAPQYKGSLYDLILQRYQNLTPIEVRNVARLIV